MDAGKTLDPQTRSLEQVGREFGEFGAFAFREFHVGRDGLAFHAVVAIDEAVTAAVDVGIVDLRGVADEHDF